MASVTALLTLAGLAAGATITTTEPPLAAIQRAQATTVPQTWTSNVTGKSFDRFYQIWLENVVSIPCVLQCFVAILTVNARTMSMLRMTPTSSGWLARVSL